MMWKQFQVFTSTINRLPHNVTHHQLKEFGTGLSTTNYSPHFPLNYGEEKRNLQLFDSCHQAHPTVQEPQALQSG